MPASDEQFAQGFAPLLEVLQRGTYRQATPADVLELLSSGGRRYVLKARDGRYLAKDGSGWSETLEGAIILDDRQDAKETQKLGLEEYGVRVRVVRIRRKGTSGVTHVRLRPGLDVKNDGNLLSFMVNDAEAMHLMAALTGAQVGAKKQ